LKIGGLDTTAPLSPLFYALYWGLRQAVEQSSIDAVADSVRDVLNAHIDELTDQTFRGESILSDPWEKVIIEQYRAMSFGHDVERSRADGRIVVRPRFDHVCALAQAQLTHAQAIIASTDPTHSQEIKHYLRGVKLFSGSCSPGGSTIQAQGVIFMVPAHERSSDPVIYYVDWLIHECSHMHLSALMLIDPLASNLTDDVGSPLRPDKRPLHGVMHAGFVLYRLVRFFRKLHAEPACMPVSCRLSSVQERLALHEVNFCAAVDTIEQAAHLTECGQEWFTPIAQLRRSI